MANALFEADFTGTGNNFQSCIPRNYKDTRFQVIFTNDFPSATLQAILFEFVNDPTGEKNADNIYQFIAKYGVNQGIPYRISVDGVVLFVGVIDLPKRATRRECVIIKAPLKRIGGIDWFMECAQASPFRAMYDNGLFSPPPGDPGYNPNAKFFYGKIPYALTFRDYEQGLLTFIQEITLILHTYKAAADTVADANKLGTDAANDTAVAGTISGIVAGDVLALVGQVAYDVFLLASLTGLTENLINQTVGVTKYKYCMSVMDLINAGLYYINNILGSTVPGTLTFKSTIFDGTGYGGIYKNTYIIPKKTIRPLTPTTSNLGLPVLEDFVSSLLKGGVLTTGNEAIAGTVGPPYGFQDGDLKKLFMDLKTVFNGAVKVVGTEIQFEEQHYWNNVAKFQLPNVDKPGYNANWPQPDFFNWDKLAFNYLVRFQTDSTDEMTLKNYKGTTAMCTIQPKNIRNVQYLLPPPSQDIIFPFALAKRKETYNAYEQIIMDILTAITDTINNVLVNPINALINTLNSVLSIFGAHITPLNPLKKAFGFNRIGWLELSGDSFQIPKIFIADPQGNNIVHVISDWAPSGVPQFFNSAGQPENPMSAAAMLGTPANNQFHGLNLATRGNQWLGYENKEFPMCLPDFQLLVNNTNVLTDSNGKFGKFDGLEWWLYNDIAQKATYWINENYDNDLTETLSIDGN